jgi:hypothetical protein
MACCRRAHRRWVRGASELGRNRLAPLTQREAPPIHIDGSHSPAGRQQGLKSRRRTESPRPNTDGPHLITDLDQGLVGGACTHHSGEAEIRWQGEWRWRQSRPGSSCGTRWGCSRSRSPGLRCSTRGSAGLLGRLAHPSEGISAARRHGGQKLIGTRQGDQPGGLKRLRPSCGSSGPSAGLGWRLHLTHGIAQGGQASSQRDCDHRGQDSGVAGTGVSGFHAECLQPGHESGQGLPEAPW